MKVMRWVNYRNLGEYNLAVDDANKSIELNPNEPLFYGLLGDIYADMEENDLALEAYHEYLELAGDAADPAIVEQIQTFEAEFAPTPEATMTATK